MDKYYIYFGNNLVMCVRKSQLKKWVIAVTSIVGVCSVSKAPADAVITDPFDKNRKCIFHD